MLTVFSTSFPEQLEGHPIRSLILALRGTREPLQEIQKLTKKDLGIRIGVRTGDTTAKEKAAWALDAAIGHVQR